MGILHLGIIVTFFHPFITIFTFMLSTQKLTYKYPKQDPIFYPEIICNTKDSLLILGESGVGKSTLLHMLGGLLKPTAGKVLIQDQDIYTLSTAEMDKFRGNKIGIVFQQSYYISSLTVEENLMFCRKLAGLQADKKRISNVLHRLGIPHKAKTKPSNLSKGELQRFSIARGVISEPVLLLADEPSSALDDSNCVKVIDMLKEQVEEEDCALIIVTHDHRISSEFENKITLNTQNAGA